MRILSAKKSKPYDAALSHVENAKRCYERSDLHHEWATLVADVRRAHHRKAGFMADVERLAAGDSPSEAPSFLDRGVTAVRRETPSEARPNCTEILRGPWCVRQFEKRLVKKRLMLLPNATAPSRALSHAVFADGSAA